ncbi:OmpA-like domain-containing protein [uncultured Gammaproteobacteria bacterium]
MALKRRGLREIGESDAENYFVSMTDIMVGLIFMFIIMLMFFALKLDRVAAQGADVIKSFTTTEDIRAKILNDVREDMARKGFLVQIFPEEGVLRLPESILFDKGKADLSRRGEESIATLGQSLYGNLLCYTKRAAGSPITACPDSPHTVESVQIEGHTDSDGTDNANWTLSVKRSFNAYQFMIESNPNLSSLLNRNKYTILSISGYGSKRPIQPNDSDDNKRNNRRVDVRIIMIPPKVTEMRM